MISPKPRPEPAPKPKLAILSAFYRQAMESERGRCEVLRWLRAHPLYRALCEAGVVRECRLSHTIPADRYRAYLERYVAKLVEEHNLYQHPEWERLWNNPPAVEEAQHWADRLGISPLEARRLIVFIRDNPAAPSCCPCSLESQPFEPVSGAGVSADMSKMIEWMTLFVQKYGMSEQMFSECVLSGRWDAETLSQRLGCSRDEAVRLIEMVDRLTISEVVSSPAPATPPSADAPEVVAEVWFEPDGYMNFRIASPSLSERIVIDPVRLQEWKNMYGDSVEMRSVVEAIRAVNERATATVVIAHTLCKRQQAYLRTDNSVYLRPLSQAELARELGYHRSVVSRIVRGSAIQASHRRVMLSELTPRLQQVMRLLLQAHPEWSNAQVASFLLYQHGLNISVRALAYHRRRILQEAADAGTT